MGSRTGRVKPTMILHSLIMDDFMPHFEVWREWADTLNYTAETNPVDGVSYPGIFAAVPTYGIHTRLEAVLRSRVKINALFMRLSLKGVPAPHQAHSDSSMGMYSLMVYLNRPEHCVGGTSLVKHSSGFSAEPLTQEQYALWVSDHSTPDKWEITSLCEMKANRAFIFRSDLLHRAEPLGGFGTDATNGRLVLTCFFDLL